MTKLPAALVLCLCCCAGPAPTSVAHEVVALLVDDAKIEFRDPQALAIDDDNTRFEITFTSRVLFESEQNHVVTLIHGDLHIPVNSWGRNGDESWFVFRVTPAQVRSLAHALGIAVHERAAWQGQLTGSVAFTSEPAVGAEHLPMRFTMTNTGPVALWFLDGGRGRNELGRDNRFQFEILRNGERLETRTVVDFGGMGVYRRLAPGDSWTFEPDLAHWLVPDRPGNYTLRVAYEAELMPAEYEPGTALPMGWQTHLQRTRTVSADLTAAIR